MRLDLNLQKNNFMDILNALNWRYATKSFDPDKIIPPSQIQAIKEAFNLTPMSYGLQPVKLLVISNKEIQQKLFQASYKQQQVTTASHVLVICVEKDIDRHFIENYFDLVKKIRHTPDSILKPYKDFLIDDFDKKDKKQTKQWSVNQAYLALGNILTVCAIQKIDACPMEGFQPKQYAEVLGLDTDKIEPVLVMPIGYRHENDKFSSFQKVRRPLAETVIDINN